MAAAAKRLSRNCSSRIDLPYLINKPSTEIPKASTALDVRDACSAKLGWTTALSELPFDKPTARLARLAASPKITFAFKFLTAR